MLRDSESFEKMKIWDYIWSYFEQDFATVKVGIEEKKKEAQGYNKGGKKKQEKKQLENFQNESVSEIEKVEDEDEFFVEHIDLEEQEDAALEG